MPDRSQSHGFTGARLILWALLPVLTTFLIYVLWHPPMLIIGGLALASFLLHATIATALVVVVAAIARRMLPAAVREGLRSRRIYFHVVVAACLLVFAVVGFELNHRWLPARLHPATIAVDILLVVLVVRLALLLLRPSARTAAGLAISVVVVVIATAAVHALTRGGADEREDPLQKLATIPYLTWVPAGGSRDTSGVVYHDRDRAYPGLNLYVSRNLPAAFLVDMDGHVVHEWRAPVYDIDTWEYSLLLDDNSLLAMARQQLFLRVDGDSRIRWARAMHVHHDVAVANDTLYVLERDERIARIGGIPVPVLEDKITRMTLDGTKIDETSLFDILRGYLDRGHAIRIYRWALHPSVIRSMLPHLVEEGLIFNDNRPVDVLHTNTIEIIQSDHDDVFKRGNVIICTRDLDRVWVIDLNRKKAVWSWGEGVLDWPHNPSLLDNGNLLVFDNGSHRFYSRVLEFDPREERIVWEYRAETPSDFFSYTSGGAQRLPNGNTLITNSDSGHVFEVTPGGEIVWEFLNPELSGDGTLRASIYRMRRIALSAPPASR